MENTDIDSHKKELVLLLGILFVGALLRLDFSTLPMNDEVFYVIASAGYVNNFYHVDGSYFDQVNPEHPPIAKLFFSSTCLLQNCSLDGLKAYSKSYVLSNPVGASAQAVKDLRLLMQIVSFWVGMLFIVGAYFVFRSEGFIPAITVSSLVAISPLYILYSNVVMLDIFLAGFFALAIWFYFLVYRRNRSLKNLFILCLLMVLAFGSKQYLGLLLLPLIVISDFVDLQKIDLKLWRGLGVTYLFFFLFVYPFKVFLNYLGFFQVGSSSNFYPMQIVQFLAMQSFVLLFLLVYSLRKLKIEKDRELFLAWVILLLGLFFACWNRGIFVPRYTIYLISLMLLPIGLALRNCDKRILGVIIILFLVSVAHQYKVQPYYEDYNNGLVSFNSSVPIERQADLGALEYLKDTGMNSFQTNDFYGFPYSSYLNATHFLTYGKNCDFKSGIFVYRKDSWRHLADCQEFPRVFGNDTKVVWNDAYFTIYRIS